MEPARRQPPERIARSVARNLEANLAFTGSRGFGKSVTARALLDERPRWIYVDPSDKEYAEFTCTNLGDVFRAMQWSSYGIVYRCGEREEKQVRLDVERILAQAARTDDHVTVCVDELGVLLEEGSVKWPKLTKAMRLGRHRRVSVWLISQRLVDLPASNRFLTDTVYMFHAHENVDLERAKQISKDLPETLRHLPELVCVEWDARSGDTCLKSAAHFLPR